MNKAPRSFFGAGVRLALAGIVGAVGLLLLITKRTPAAWRVRGGEGARRNCGTIPSGVPTAQHDFGADEHKREERRYWKRNYNVALGQAIATVSGLLLAGFAFVAAWRTMSATQEQARVAQDTLLAGNRPWLMLTDVKPISLSSDDASGVTLRVRMSAKNVGHSPAQNVSVSAGLLIYDFDPGPNEALTTICRTASKSPEAVIPGNVIFPDQAQDIPWGLPGAFDIQAERVWAARAARIRRAHDVEMSRNRPERAQARTEALSMFPFYAPLYLVGCINYRSSDNKMLFQTSFMFEVGRRPNSQGFPLLSGDAPVVRYPEPHPNDPETLMVFGRQMQRVFPGDEVELSSPLYATFAN